MNKRLSKVFSAVLLAMVGACGGDLPHHSQTPGVVPGTITPDDAGGSVVPTPAPLPVITLTRNEDTISEAAETGVLCSGGMAPVAGGCECLNAPYSNVIYSRPGGPYKQAWQCGCSQPGVIAHVVCMGIHNAVLRDTSL